jgi:hypothetical protein
MSHKLLLFSILAGIASVGMLLSYLYENSEVTAAIENWKTVELPKHPQSKSPLLIKVFRYTAVGEYGLDNVVEADSLEVRPRRFMVFNAKSINEAILINARLALYTYENKEPYSDLFEFESALPFAGSSNDSGRSRVLGRVTRLVADTITIELFRDDLKIIVLEAAVGLIDKKKKGAKFFNVTLQHVLSNRIVRAENMLWDRKREVFIIPGEYIDIGPSGRVTGKSVEIDIDFKITPYEGADKLNHRV